jgi:hypothetical protein
VYAVTKKKILCMDLSNHHECRLCSFDDDEEEDDEDDDADSIGNFNDVSSSVLWLWYSLDIRL